MVCAGFITPPLVTIKFKTLHDFVDANALNIWKFISSNLDTGIIVQSIGDTAIDCVNGPLWTIFHELATT
jgi:hypothetical protein